MRKKTGKIWSLSKHMLEEIVHRHSSLANVILELGLIASRKYNFIRLKERLIEDNIDFSNIVDFNLLASVDKTSYVYVLENIAVTYYAVYVGKANDPLVRLSTHIQDFNSTRNRHQRCYFYQAMRKYKPENFRLHIVEECESENKAFEKEKEWISYFKLMNVHIYNISPGGYGGQKKKTSEETRLKMSEISKKRCSSFEYREK